nr:MAG TPA_asm: hypothetical protein [Caudoviricetes sp.]
MLGTRHIYLIYIFFHYYRKLVYIVYIYLKTFVFTGFSHKLSM